MFKCIDKHWINTTTTWYIEISDVTLQPFNLTNEGFGAIEDCTGIVLPNSRSERWEKLF